MKLVLQCILENSNHYNEALRLLPFCVPAVDDQIVKSLEKIIDDEELLMD